MSNPNWNVYLINRSVTVALSVDKSKLCHVWLDFGSVLTPESVSASNFTPGTDSACSDAINASHTLSTATHYCWLPVRVVYAAQLPAAGLAVRVVYAARAVARRLHAFLG
jgi:hypothetical protein